MKFNYKKVKSTHNRVVGTLRHVHLYSCTYVLTMQGTLESYNQTDIRTVLNTYDAVGYTHTDMYGQFYVYVCSSYVLPRSAAANLTVPD